MASVQLGLQIVYKVRRKQSASRAVQSSATIKHGVMPIRPRQRRDSILVIGQSATGHTAAARNCDLQHRNNVLSLHLLA